MGKFDKKIQQIHLDKFGKYYFSVQFLTFLKKVKYLDFNKKLVFPPSQKIVKFISLLL